MDRVLFGDNQFFGVNHMSEEKARAQAMRFKDTAAIMRGARCGLRRGHQTFMCTTHDRVGEICDIVRANPQRYQTFEFYPCMPYAHKYANAVSEVGMFEAVQALPQAGAVVALFTRRVVRHARKDMRGASCSLLIDAEMKCSQGLTTPVIFLQNVVTDLLLGLS